MPQTAPTGSTRRFTVTEKPSGGARKKEVVVSAAEGTSISVKKCGEPRRSSQATRRLHSERLVQLRAAEARAQTLENTLVRAVGAGIGAGVGAGAGGRAAAAAAAAARGGGETNAGFGPGLAPDDFDDSGSEDGEEEGAQNGKGGRGATTLPLDIMHNDEVLKKNLDLIATAAEEANASSLEAVELQRTMASAAGGAAEEAVQPVPDMRLTVPAVAPLPMQPFTGADWRPRMRVTPEAVEEALRESVAARRAVRVASAAATSDLRRHVESSQRAEEVLRLHELRTATVFSPVLKNHLVGSHAAASQAHSVLQRGLHDRRVLLRRRERLLRHIHPTPAPREAGLQAEADEEAPHAALPTGTEPDPSHRNQRHHPAVSRSPPRSRPLGNRGNTQQASLTAVATNAAQHGSGGSGGPGGPGSQPRTIGRSLLPSLPSARPASGSRNRSMMTAESLQPTMSRLRRDNTAPSSTPPSTAATSMTATTAAAATAAAPSQKSVD